MSHVANSALLDEMCDMYDELDMLKAEMAFLDAENMLLEAADVYEQILKLNKKLDELAQYF